MGRTVTVDLYADIKALGKSQCTVSCTSVSFPDSTYQGQTKPGDYIIYTECDGTGVVTDNDKTLSSKYVDFWEGSQYASFSVHYMGYATRIGSCNLTVSSGADVGTYNIKSTAYETQKNYQNKEYSVDSDSGVLIIIDSSTGDDVDDVVSYETGTITVKNTDTDVPSPIVTISGTMYDDTDISEKSYSLSSGTVVITAWPGSYVLSFSCEQTGDNPYFPPDDVSVSLSSGEDYSYTAVFSKAYADWVQKVKTTVTRSFADTSGLVRCISTVVTEDDGSVSASMETEPGKYISDLFELPKSLLPVNANSVHKTVLASDTDAVLQLGEWSSDIQLVGIHLDAHHDRIATAILNKGARCVSTSLDVPLNTSIHPGDSVSRYNGRVYFVLEVTHDFGARKTTLSLERKPTMNEIFEVLIGDRTDLGKAVVAAIRAASKKVDNIRIGVVLERIDYKTYTVRLNGQSASIRAVADRTIIGDALVGSLVLVAKATQVF